MAVLMAAEPLLSAEEKATEKVRFGNFEVVNDSEGRPVLLGKGTFGRTYQARHCFLDTNTLPTVPAATAAPVIAVAPEPTVTRQSSSYMSWTGQLTQFVRDYVDSTGDSNVERA